MGFPDLPLASGQRHKEVFLALGWVVQKDDNHIVMTHANYPEVYLSIPNHKEVKRGTLKSIVREAGITDQEYAVFFQAKPRTNRYATPLTDEDLFGHTPMNGEFRVHCKTCGNEVCISSDADHIAKQKEEHLAHCSGDIS